MSKLFNFRHMKQHEQDDYVDFSKMSESEVIMHHFKQFDHDKDGKLDGLEVLKQIQRQNGNLKWQLSYMKELKSNLWLVLALH